MKKNIKVIFEIIIAFIIGISTTVTAATVFNSKDITYSNSATTKKNVKDSLDELYIKTSEVGKCPKGFLCGDSFPISLVKVGDYISMTPTATSYTPSSNDTGCMNDSKCTQNTINPSELNLWRVIKKNDDGTVDMVSDKVSSKKVCFYGKTGHTNYTYALKTIASQYTDGKHVAQTRYISHSDNTSPTDLELVNTAYKGTVGEVEYTGAKAYISGSTSFGSYWISETQKCSGPGYCSVFYMTEVGYKQLVLLAIPNEDDKVCEAVRPIITLKSNLIIVSGDGKSAETAFQLR